MNNLFQCLLWLIVLTGLCIRSENSINMLVCDICHCYQINRSILWFVSLVFLFPSSCADYLTCGFVIYSFSYTLFPLLLLLDAAVNCRSPPKVEGSVMVDIPKVPHKVSDVAAEGVLQCLEELLKKCHLGSVDQVYCLECHLGCTCAILTCFSFSIPCLYS